MPDRVVDIGVPNEKVPKAVPNKDIRNMGFPTR